MYLAAACFCAAHVSLLAQVEKNDRDIVLDTIDVVAKLPRQRSVSVNKLDVPMNHMPLAVSTLKMEKLEVRGFQDIESATRFIPGVKITPSYGGLNKFSIRGLQNAPIMVDGMRNERTTINSFPMSDLSNVESIELLKGPASILAGQSAMGGVLNIVRKRSSAERSVYARLSYGSYNEKRSTLGMGGKLAGPVNYYANVNYMTSDGWRDNGNERFSGYLALSANLSEKDKLDFRASFNDDFYGTEMGLPDYMSADVFNKDGSPYLKKGDMLPDLDKTARYNNESDFFFHRGHDFSLTYKHEFNEHIRLENRAYITYSDMDYSGTEGMAYLTSKAPIYDHWQLNYRGEKEYICFDSVRLSTPTRFSHLNRTLGNQFELLGAFNTGAVKHNYLGGYSLSLFSMELYGGYKPGDIVGPGLNSIVAVNNPISTGGLQTKFSTVQLMNQNSHSVYVQDLMDINEKLKVLVAGRMDNYLYKTCNTFDTNSGERNDYTKPSDEAFNSIKNNAFSYRAGVVYLPTPELSLFGSFASSFSPITMFYDPRYIYVNKEGYQFTPNKDGEVFKPINGYQTEVGVKYDPTSNLSLSANVFYILRNNSTSYLGSMQIEENGQMATKYIQGQVGRYANKGFDLEANYAPVAGLSLSAAYSFTDARILDAAKVKDPELLQYITGDPNKYSGTFLAGVPKQTFYAMADYTIQQGVFKGLGALISTSFSDKIYFDATNTKTTPAYWLTDAALFYQVRQDTRLSVNVNNIFSAEYNLNAYGTQYSPSMPCNFQVSVTYEL